MSNADRWKIRRTVAEDLPEILALYPKVFPDEDLRPVVSNLLRGEAAIISLVACNEAAIIGHVIFTLFDDRDEAAAGALLGPLGVMAEYQGEGVGGALVKEGFRQLAELGVRQVFVLGDPAYYGRFGFDAEPNVLPPYELPAEWTGAWQSLLLLGQVPLTAGPCTLPEAWMERSLWGP